MMASGRGSDDNSEDDGNGVCGTILTAFSLFLIAITFPFSLCLVIKMVQVQRRITNGLIQGESGGREPGLGCFDFGHFTTCAAGQDDGTSK